RRPPGVGRLERQGGAHPSAAARARRPGRHGGRMDDGYERARGRDRGPMKPPRFDYVLPRGVEEALSVLAQHGEQAKVLAGGQSLVPLLNFRLVRPAYLVDLNDVAGLDGIRVADGRLCIGAMTRQRAVETSALVHERCSL